MVTKRKLMYCWMFDASDHHGAVAAAAAAAAAIAGSDPRVAQL